MLTPPVADRRFRAMGSDAHLVVVGSRGGPDPHGLAELAEARIAELEARWSRFRPDSEVSELNRRTGEAVAVSADTILLVERAIEAWRLTGGSFDPTVLGAMLTAGYDRSFDAGLDTGPETGRDREAAAPRRLLAGCTDIELTATTVRLPAGSGFDAGGIGKGLGADLVTAELRRAGAAGACVNLGGDLRVSGTGPTGGTWTVAIEHPWSPTPVALVGLADGALATSTTLLRRWTSGGESRHHLIDPATGEPSDTDLDLATVIAAEAWIAEVLAKAVLLRGADRAFDLLDPRVANALTVDRDGTVRATSGLAAHLGGAPLSDRLAAPSPTSSGPTSSDPTSSDPTEKDPS